ncbi:hypothetical protein AURDEDRAFT_81444 [Auricularia subglabra TFB-10046 SS5]|nr:hypothetical protein AURDEDRAFT_81444 [Auricularia subglabra TFB-10046 SS5]
MNPASTSVPSPTLIPLRPKFPLLLPIPPQPHALPLAPRSWRKVRLASRRDINNELAQLSEEETEIEEQLQGVRTRGSTFLVPIGKTMTLQEEKNDTFDPQIHSNFSQAATETSDGGSEESDGTGGDEGDNGESASGVEQDLDASLEDMDAQDENSDGDEDGDPDTSGFSMEADPVQTSSPPMR